MPIYTYINPKEETIEVIRRMSDIDNELTEEETEGKEGPWKRIMGGGTDFRRTGAFGNGKGFFNGQQPTTRRK